MKSILFKIGPVPIRAYGLMILVGFLIGLWRAVRVSKRYKISREQVIDVALVILLAGVVGARVLFLLMLVPQEGWGVFAEIHRLWEGGLSFHGGLIGASAAAAMYVRSKKIPFLMMTDLLAPSVAIGYAFARIGCFLNGCCYGAETHLPWAVDFFDHAKGLHTGPSHPAQLYAFLISLGIFAILTRIERLHRPSGFVFFSYLVLYSIYRFGIEFVRKGATAHVWLAGMTHAQIVSLLGIIIFGVVLILMNKKAARSKS